MARWSAIRVRTAATVRHSFRLRRRQLLERNVAEQSTTVGCVSPGRRLCLADIAELARADVLKRTTTLGARLAEPFRCRLRNRYRSVSSRFRGQQHLGIRMVRRREYRFGRPELHHLSEV